MKSGLPNLDRAIDTLVEDLADRGMYDTVALCVMGDFGRTPRVNGNAGRDHWGQSGFTLLWEAAASVAGRLSARQTPKANARLAGPSNPAAFLRRFTKCMASTPRQTYNDNSGRPHPLVAESEGIHELI